MNTTRDAYNTSIGGITGDSAFCLDGESYYPTQEGLQNIIDSITSELIYSYLENITSFGIRTLLLI